LRVPVSDRARLLIIPTVNIKHLELLGQLLHSQNCFVEFGGLLQAGHADGNVLERLLAIGLPCYHSELVTVRSCDQIALHCVAQAAGCGQGNVNALNGHCDMGEASACVIA